MSYSSFFEYFSLNLQEYSTTEIILIVFVIVLVVIILVFIFSDQSNTKTFASLPYENFTVAPDQPYGTPLASVQELQNLTTQRPVVLLVYDMNCGYCKQFKSIWQQLFTDNDLNQIVSFRSAGGGENGEVRSEVERAANVSGYPSIYVVASNSNNGVTYHEYSGSRDFYSLKQFITTFKIK
jgi:hypothetical protein